MTDIEITSTEEVKTLTLRSIGGSNNVLASITFNAGCSFADPYPPRPAHSPVYVPSLESPKALGLPA